MALRCLACDHDNSAGDRFCGACGSSLDLRLCPGCEAVNRRGDTSCHSCGATLAAEAVVPRRAEVAPTAPGKRVGRWIKRAAIALPLAGIAALAAYAYEEPWLAQQVVDAIRAAAERTVAMATAAVKGETTGAEAAMPAAAAVSVGLIKEPAPPRPVVKVEVEQVEAREKASAPARVPEPSLEEPRPSPGGAGRPRVTHTRAAAAQPLAEAAPPRLVVAPPAVAATPPAVEAGKDQSAGSRCTEEVIALGLCSTNAKGEGK